MTLLWDYELGKQKYPPLAIETNVEGASRGRYVLSLLRGQLSYIDYFARSKTLTTKVRPE